MEPKVKHLTEHMIEILKKAKDDTTLIKMWVELTQFKWPNVLPDIKGGATRKNMAAVGAWIVDKVGRKACSKYWNCEHLKSMTEKEFDSFWTKTYEHHKITSKVSYGDQSKRVRKPAIPPNECDHCYDNGICGYCGQAQPAKKKKKSKKKKG